MLNWTRNGVARHTTRRTAALRPELGCEALEDRSVPASVSLGAAGNFAVLGLENTQITNSNVTVNGNEGVSQGGKLKNMAPSTVTGTVFQYAAGQYSGPGKLFGGVVTDPVFLAQADADARAAAAQAAALPPTQTLGAVGSATTVTGNGGLNVIAVNGDIKQGLTLTGTADDVFIVNVSGGLALGGSAALGLSGGVTAGHVLYNFTGTGGTISTHVGNVLNGTLLAPAYSFSLDGLFNGEIIGGGKSITLLSGARVNQVPFTPPPPPATTSSLSGFVYIDFNSNGVKDEGEAGVAGVLITLTGTDDQGNDVLLTTLTGDDGSYHFTGLRAGTYALLEEQPANLADGQDAIGSLGGQTGDDLFYDIHLGAGVDGFDYNYGETRFD